MTRGKPGQDAYWIENRREFLDGIDAMMTEHHNLKREEQMEYMHLLIQLLQGRQVGGRTVTVAEPHNNDTLYLQISRAGDQKGYDDMYLHIVSPTD